MNKKDINKTINVVLKDSRQKRLFIIIPHLISLFIIVVCVLWLETKLSFLVFSLFLILLSFIYCYKLHINKNLKHSIDSFSVNVNGNCYLTLYENNKQHVLISARSFVSNYFILLIFAVESNKTYTALITRDSLEDNQFRRLKIYINTHKLSR